MLLAQDFMDKVEGLRVAYGRPLRISSAARCPEHNAKVSGTGRTGPHTTGRAIDLAVSHAEAWHVLSLVMRYGFTGIGVQQKGSGRFIHLDDLPNAEGQPRPTVWSY
jgi:uncharacterized protein YcbK (DUF882 family)